MDIIDGDKNIDDKNIDNNDKRQKRRKFKTKKQKRLERKNGFVNRQDDRDINPRTNNYDNVIKKNESFEYYYHQQNLFNNDEEFKEFLNILKEPLPTTFRISSFCMGQLQRMKNIIKSDYIKKFQLESTNNNENDEKNLQITSIPWYPNELAWQINLTKNEIRKSRTINLLHKFLICETETGDISRQEAVSMIPPLLLDIKPGQTVLDMCAAPGSKTAQIIEMLHQECGSTFIIDDKKDKINQLDGLVVANDIDNRRCYMLAHQSKRLSSPCVVITNHDAANLPNFYQTDSEKGQKKIIKFDRILADVLCSGDGTFRKNYDVWNKWNANNANNLHNIQLKIAKRGLELLKKDGIMAYSTCSLNPVENEAVIAALLNLGNRDGKNELELIDPKSILPKLKYYPGIKKWKVMDKDNNLIEKIDDVPEKYHSQIRSTHFTPTNSDELNLQYCLRIMPHYQNTGGFFIALIRKNVNVLSWENNNSNDNVDNNNDDEDKKEKKKSKGSYPGFKEEPFNFLDENDTDWIALKSYFKFPEEFTSKQLAHRCVQGRRRNLYFMTRKAANFIETNRDIKIISGGVRVFNRTDVNHKCPYRITQEGIVSIFPYFIQNLQRYDLKILNVNDQCKSEFKIVEVKKKFFIELLKNQDLKIEKQIDDDEIKKLFISNGDDKLNETIPSGCFIMYIKLNLNDEDDNGKKFLLPICVWRGKSLLRAYVAKNDRQHLLRLCDYEPILEQQHHQHQQLLLNKSLMNEIKGENKRLFSDDNNDDDDDDDDDDDENNMDKKILETATNDENNQNHSSVEKRIKRIDNNNDNNNDNDED